MSCLEGSLPVLMLGSSSFVERRGKECPVMVLGRNGNIQVTLFLLYICNKIHNIKSDDGDMKIITYCNLY
jgi:hypothetical protein